MAENRGTQIAAAGLAVTLLCNIVLCAFGFGRLFQRVEAVEKNTNLLLEHVIQRNERASK